MACEWRRLGSSILERAIDHLTQGRAEIHEAILAGSDLQRAGIEIEQAVSEIRRSGQLQYLPGCLLTRAWLRSLTGPGAGPESAQSDLDEAWEIAERGPMKLHMADIHLHRARLFFRENEYPKEWISPQADLAAARKLVEQCGYGRRKEELEDAERAILK